MVSFLNRNRMAIGGDPGKIGLSAGRKRDRNLAGKRSIRPLRIEDGCRLLLKPANDVVSDWVSENFSDVIKSALIEVSGAAESWTLEFVAPEGPDFTLT